MYLGGGFALGNALGWVQIVDRMFRTDGGMGRQLFGVFTGPRAMRRAVLRLPVADADIALTGRQVRWFQEWIRHGPDDRTGGRRTTGLKSTGSPGGVSAGRLVRLLPLCGMLADYVALQAAGRTVRLVIGPWGHGRGLYTRNGMHDALAALDAVLADDTPPSGCGCSLPVPAAGPTCPAGHRPPATPPGICIRPGGLALTRPPPARQAGFAMIRRTRPRPSQVPPSECPPAQPITGASRPDRTFLPSAATPKPPIWR
jgi:hypothetical protein